MEEATSWAADVHEGAGSSLMRVKQWDPLPYETWVEIRERGFSRNSWVCTIFITDGSAPGFSMLFAAKRLDKMITIGSVPAPAGSTVGLQVVVAEGTDRYDFTSWRDGYIKLRAIGLSDAGFEAYSELPDGSVSSARCGTAEILEQLLTQAALKAGWTA